VKRFVFMSAVAVASLSSSCMGYPRLLNQLFDRGGWSLNSPAAEENPQITGRYIVFTSDRRFSQDVYLYDMIDRRMIELPRLNSLEAIASHPSVSTDGRYITFAASRQGRSDIYLYDRSMALLRNLTSNLKTEVRNPTISADGTTIAFEANANGQWDIFVYDRSGRPLNIWGNIP